MFRGFSLLVLTAAAGAAHAAGEPGFNAKDPAALYDNLQSMGYAPDPIDAKSDPPSTVITASGSRYWVVTGGCTAGRDCRYIVVGASFNDVVDPPADWLAKQNRDFDLIKVWLNDKKWLTYSATLPTEGLTRSQFRNFMDGIIESEAALGKQATEDRLIK